MQVTVSHCLKMAKKGHPSPGFEPAPLEGSKKNDEILTKALPLSHGGFYLCWHRIFLNTSKESKINYK